MPREARGAGGWPCSKPLPAGWELLDSLSRCSGGVRGLSALAELHGTPKVLLVPPPWEEEEEVWGRALQAETLK